MAICLIGESDWFMLQTFERFATAAGFQVERVQVGQELVAAARALKPDVIVLNIELPGLLRGWEAALAIQSAPNLRHIPIIGCSRLDPDDVRIRVSHLAAYIRKPNLSYTGFVAALAAANLKLAAGNHAEAS